MSRKPTQLIPAPKADPLLAKRRKKNLTEKKGTADSPSGSVDYFNSDDATSQPSSPSDMSEQQEEPAEEERPKFDKAGNPIKPHSWLSQRCGSRYSELDKNYVITWTSTQISRRIIERSAGTFRSRFVISSKSTSSHI